MRPEYQEYTIFDPIKVYCIHCNQTFKLVVDIGCSVECPYCEKLTPMDWHDVYTNELNEYYNGIN
jgi:hypothetical protein